VRLSIAYVHPASNKHTCSCTCTNSIIFDQLLPSSSQAGGSCCSSLEGCQAEKGTHIKSEQELNTQLNEEGERHSKREEELSADLRTCKEASFRYKGCWKDKANRVLKGSQRRLGQSTENLKELGCVSNCGGDSSQICGGCWSLSLYSKEV
jgi:hypothetical protein